MNETCERGCCEWTDDGVVTRYTPHTAAGSDSPELVEMRAAVKTLNAAEERMVRELPAAGPREAALLATEVRLARREFDRAFDALSAALASNDSRTENP